MPTVSERVRLIAAAGIFLCASNVALGQSPVPVEVAMPETGQAMRTLQLSGSVTARRAAMLSPRVPGLVAAMEVDAGDRVQTGDLLLRLDDKLAKLAVAEAEAALEESRAAQNEARRLVEEGRRLVGDNYLSQTEVGAREPNSQ